MTLELTTRFLGLLCSGLAAGMALCVLLAERAFSGSGRFYTELMQLLRRALTVPGPALGALGLLSMSVSAVLAYRSGGGPALWLGLLALALAMSALAITKFGHFPINAVMGTWNPDSPPAEWKTVQARWTALHVARTAAATGSFALFLMGALWQ